VPSPLPSDIYSHRFLQPCARCRASIHIYCRSFVYSPDTSSHTTPCGLSPAEHSLLIRSPHVAHIVCRFGLKYKYPSPVLANARQLWPPLPSLSFVCVPGNCGPSFSRFHDALDEHSRAAAGITTRVHRSRLPSARARFRVRSSGFIFDLSSRTLARTFRLRYTMFHVHLIIFILALPFLGFPPQRVHSTSLYSTLFCSTLF